MDDAELLRQYATTRSEGAFRALVDRHVDFVYAVALRQLCDAHRAQEVTQSVFIDLAAKAASMPPKVVLTGWLFRAARFAAAKVLRGDARRHRREWEAMSMMRIEQNQTESNWEDLQPLLNEALESLPERDRDVVLLRFFEKKSVKEMAERLELEEAAARKRVMRAVDKLRVFFERRGIAATSAGLAAALLTQPAVAAPAGLSTIIVTAALSQTTTVATTITFGKQLLSLMALSKAQTAVVSIAAVLLVGGATTTYVVQHSGNPATETAAAAAPAGDESTIRQIIDQMNSRALDKAPPIAFVGDCLTGSERQGAISTNKRFMGKAATIRELLALAYGTSRTRVRTGSLELPSGRFDYLISLPSGQREALQSILRERFGLEAHPGTQEEDVYVLTARAGDFENLRPAEGFDGGSRVMNNDDSMTLHNMPIGGLARNLEQIGALPVIDETRLRGRYDIVLNWEPPPGENARRGPPSLETITKALSEQLGIDLQKERRELEVLLVNAVKAGK